MKIQINGRRRLEARLKSIAESGPDICRAAVRAGCAVLAAGCRDASPGSIKEECGFSVRRRGVGYIGRAGLMRFPRRGDGQSGPHGVYVDQGTKHISPRRFLAAALRANKARARLAMRRAAKSRIRSAGKP